MLIPTFTRSTIKLLPPLFRHWGWLLVVAALMGTAIGAPLSNAAVLPQPGNSSEIQVVTNQQETQFPESVTFTLVAQGTSDLTEVRFHYRFQGARRWSQARPDFLPGKQITARFDLPTDGANYLPLGAQIEYYYLIRDISGNATQTPIQNLEYMDSRFQWRQAQTGPLTLYYHDIQKSRIEDLTEEVGPELSRLAQFLQIDLSQPMKGFIYSRRSDALPAFPNQNEASVEQGIFHGFAFPRYGVFVGFNPDVGLIVHESAHLMLSQAMGPEAGSIPSWLDEGFASYREPGASPYSGRSLSGRSMPLREMTRTPETAQDIRIFYQKAESVVALLMREYGDDTFQEFLGRLRQGTSMDDALLTAYGFNVDGLDELWANDTSGRPAPVPGAPSLTSPFANFDAWLIGVVALVVLTATATRYLVNKMRPAPVEEGAEAGLQPWEDPDLADFDDEDFSNEDDHPTYGPDERPPTQQ